MPDLWMDVDTALSEAPVNLLPLLDDTDFKTRETAIAYNEAGMDLVWNFVTTGGAFTQTPVTPTTGGDYDWTHQGDGMYTIEIPASGGASINNDTEGFGWFTGLVTGVLPWRGPVVGFRASGLNDKLIDSAYSATRGLAGTALPDAAADAAGGLPISDVGGLDLDVQIGTDIDAILADTGTDGVVLADNAITAAKVATDAIDAGAIAADAIGSSELATAAVNEIVAAVWAGITAAAMQSIADEILKRSWENVEDAASTDSLAEILGAALNSAIAGTTWTIKKPSDDSTFNTRTVTTDAAADPITGVT